VVVCVNATADAATTGPALKTSESTGSLTLSRCGIA
jgi:hypothetical protein